MSEAEKRDLNALDIARLLEAFERRVRQVEVLASRLRAAYDGMDRKPQTIVAFPLMSAAAEPHAGPQQIVDRGKDLSYWPRDSGDAPPLRPGSGWANVTALLAPATKTIAFSVCGLPRDQIEEVVRVVANEQARTRNLAPVFLTDSSDFDAFRRHGYTFEYFPPPEAWPAGAERSWLRRARQWLDHVMAKWRIRRVVQFGPHTFPRTTKLDPTSAPAARAAAFPAAGLAARSGVRAARRSKVRKGKPVRRRSGAS